VKKTIKRPDGTEEVVEGTAEEIAEYERKLREGSKPSKKKPVLHGAEVDGVPLSASEEMLIRMSRMGFLKKEEPEKVPVFIPQYMPYRLLETGVGTPACSFCGQYNCNQLHIWCSDQTTTGTTLTIGDGLFLNDKGSFTPSS
jgi:hypothetical protein